MAEDILDAEEIILLRKLVPKRFYGPCPTAQQALHAIASMGGHQKRNGKPGWLTLTRGFQLFAPMAKGFKIARTCDG